ncbi:MAG: hypothetical protein WBB07_23530 [Mycobacterium sp.]
MSRPIRPRSANRRRRIHACTIESMPLDTDPTILHAVNTVYTTDLGLPDEWTDTQRAEFIAAEAEKITWMVRAEAGTLGDRRVALWKRQHCTPPHPRVEDALRRAARTDAVRAVMHQELYELIASDDEDL